MLSGRDIQVDSAIRGKLKDRHNQCKTKACCQLGTMQTGHACRHRISTFRQTRSHTELHCPETITEPGEAHLHIQIIFFRSRINKEVQRQRPASVFYGTTVYKMQEASNMYAAQFLHVKPMKPEIPTSSGHWFGFQKPKESAHL